MEGNLSQGGMIQGGASFGGFDLPNSIRVHLQQAQQHPHSMNQHQTHPCLGSSVQSSFQDGFPLTMGTFQKCDQNQTPSLTDFSQGDRNKNSPSDEEEPSFAEEGVDGHQEAARAKKPSPWQRVKWTDKMVKLLITALSYIGEDAASDGGGGGIARRKFTALQKKGKWRSVSKAMAERGHHVSPQQCEDKFNDLNKRYKKLNDMLGRGTTCQVVENPGLLDVIDYLSEKDKDDVRKILNSRHLFYEEMCSYHNGNRLHLPHDPALQRSLQVALRNRDDQDNDDVRKSSHDEDEETDDLDDFDENYANNRGSLKRLKPGQGQEDSAATFGSALNSLEHNKSSFPQMVQSDVSQALPENMKAALSQKQSVEPRALQLEEKKLQIQAEFLELEKQRFLWQKFSIKKNRELESIKLENERMKLENERMALELKRKESKTIHA
ncbi:uncharacterized protein LOC109817293 [Cajanus cajan]|uniref:uncharacterized protein LOC109817293 n=1 Tax=Cajanus cajan TaxID=3821 RepID=UPI00098D83A8|nr:uncharacterized protein LOC109817293 [Cajanus cajan]XP_020238101.1 uncharacterized protein LOC109817293 [Cajanus cajan]